MGKLAIGDGYVTPENFPKFLQNNCSGRYSHRVFDADELHAELLQYDSFNGELLHDFVVEHLNIEKQVKKYLELVR
jgi:hypothetical protein